VCCSDDVSSDKRVDGTEASAGSVARSSAELEEGEVGDGERGEGVAREQRLHKVLPR
jgi:hypothetical protein